MVYIRPPQSPLTVKHLSHHGTKVCILYWRHQHQVSVARRWHLDSPWFCCKSLATQELLDGSKVMKTNWLKMPIRLVAVYSITTKKLHTKLLTVPILDPVIPSPSKCCCDVTMCGYNMYQLLPMCNSYTNSEEKFLQQSLLTLSLKLLGTCFYFNFFQIAKAIMQFLFHRFDTNFTKLKSWQDKIQNKITLLWTT